MSRGNTLSQAHPVAPRAEFVRRSDPPESRLAVIVKLASFVGGLGVAALLGFIVVFAMLAPWPRP